jgi:1-acyl-sn-glycerol-3-phosphate acyltransferase
LQPPMGGALFLAQRSGATVVPIALKGNAAAFGRKHWFPRPRKITVIIGEPFQLGPDTSKEEMAQRTEQLMINLAKMLELPPPKMDKAKETPKP